MQHHTTYLAPRGLAALAAAVVLSAALRAVPVDAVSYTGGNYTQNFNSLPYTSGTSVNTNDPVTLGNAAGSPTTATKFTLNGSANATFDFAAAIDTSGTTAGSTGGLGLSSTMSGWYGGAQTAIKFGASAGDQTTGGIVSFGALTGSNRALGLLATSTTGLTTFGLELVNNTGSTLNQIDLQFTEQLWRQQTTQQIVNLGYLVAATPSAALPLTGTSALASFSFATGTSTGSTAQSAPIRTAAFNAAGTSTSVGNWANGTALWITWQTSQSSGGSQGLAIDDLTFSASLGASTPTWNTTDGTWAVGTGSNWTGGTGTAFFNGDNVAFNNTAGGTVTIAAGGVAPGNTTVSAISGTYTFTGDSLGGTGALTKSGGGTLVLSASNSYSGGTFLNGGILNVSSDAALGATTGGLTFAGGTLQTGAALTSARAVTLNGAGGTIDTNGFDSTLSGNITGAGALTKAGAGALTVSGTNTYGGGTTLAAGTLDLTGSLTLGGGSVAVSVTGNNATLTNLGTISQTGTGRAIRDNTGITGFTVTNGSATNSTALMQTADADVIQVNKANASVTLNNYGTMTSLNASAGGAQVIDFNAITNGANTVNNYSTGVMQAAEADAVRPGVNGVVNNDGLIKSTTAAGSSSDGIDAQSNTGITVVNAANNPGATIEGGRHGITGGNAVADTSGNPTVANGAYAMSITNGTGGTIQGDNGSGINIDGLNGNEVVTIVNHGTITGNGHSLGDGVAHDGDGVDVDGLVNLTNTGTIKSLNAYGGAPVNGVQAIEFSEGVTVGGGTIVNSGTIEGSVATGNATAIGRGITIAGIDKFTDTGGVDHEIAAQAPYAATSIHNQTGGLIKGDSDSGIIFSSALASGFSHTITNDTGATIQTGSTTAPAILTAADNVTINNAGTIDGSSSGKAITGGAGNLTVNLTGGTASVLGDITGGSGTNTLTFDLGAANRTFTLGGAIANFSQVEVHSGKVTLAGANTYTGATNVTGGALFVNGSLANTAVTVSDGALLGGGGLIGGSVIANGVLAPGNSVGTLTIAGNLTWNGSSSNAWQFELGAGGTSDRLLIGGDFLKGTSSPFTFDFLGSNVPAGTFTLVDWNGATTFNVADFSYVDLGGGLTGSFALNGGELDFTTASAVPEPSTYAAVAGLAALGLVGWRRFRRHAGAPAA